MAKPHSGLPSRLTAGEKEELAPILLRGLRAAGSFTDPWGLERITSVIEERFGVKYYIPIVQLG